MTNISTFSRTTLRIMLTVLGITFPLIIHSTQNRHEPYYFHNITTNDGLSHNTVNAILEDNYGFLWFGTRNGLNRYDGDKIVFFNCIDKVNSKENNTISSLYEDNKNNIWIGTERGVYIYEIEADKISYVMRETPGKTLMKRRVSEICGDNQGTIWILIPDQGCFRYTEDSLRLYKINQSHKKKSPSCISVSENGSVWLSGNNVGLLKFNRQKDDFDFIDIRFESTDGTEKSLGNEIVNDICVSGNDVIIYLNTGEILKYSESSGKVIILGKANTKEEIINCSLLVSGKLWTGTSSGLYIQDIGNSGNYAFLSHDNDNPFSLTDDNILSLYKDRSGGIWIGTKHGGVNYYPQRGLIFNTIPINTPDNSTTAKISDITIGNNGQLWIATENNGLFEIDRLSKQIKKIDMYGHEKNIILSMFSNAGKVYCGLYKKGIIELENGNIEYISPKNLFLEEGSVNNLYIDSQKNLWIATNWGLYVKEESEVKAKRVTRLGYDEIVDVIEDEDGYIWIATIGNGLCRYSPKENIHKRYMRSKLSSTNRLSSNSILSLFTDSRGKLWISTEGGGLCRYNKGTDDFTTFSKKDGLPDNTVFKILEDDKGYLWFGTNNGLVRFSPKTYEVRVFTQNSGLLSNQFYHNAACKDSNGILYFGNNAGIVCFDPRKLDSVNIQPPIYISEFSIFDQEISVQTDNSPINKNILEVDKLVLNHKQSTISFKVSLPSEFFIDKRFYYMLSPYDKQWKYAANPQEVKYENLTPGKYSFIAKTDTSGYETTNTSRCVSIHILPPWWKSSIAYSIYITLISGIFISFFFFYSKRKTKQLQAHKKEYELQKNKEFYNAKLNLFTEIAHEIRTPLTLINGELEIINKTEKDNNLLKKINIISNNVNRLFSLSSQIMDFHNLGITKTEIKFDHINLNNLLETLTDDFKQTFLNAKKEIGLKLPASPADVVFDEESIIKIISNLLTNAMKYSDKYAEVELAGNEYAYVVKIRNDGELIPENKAEAIFDPFYQIDSNKSGFGMGLAISRSLAEMNNAKLYYDLEERSDNVFILEIPISNDKYESSQSLPKPDTADDIIVNTGFTENGFHEDMTVLVVEDDEDVAEMIATQLGMEFKVETANNGKIALEIINRKHIDIILSDIKMPVMDGFQLCSIIKSDINISHIPVVFLTAMNDLDTKVKGLKTGAVAFIEKPFSFDYLKSVLKSILTNRNMEREAFLNRPFFPINNVQMSTEDESFMEKVIKIINNNISDSEFNVEQLSKELFMSRSNLLRKIKTLFNMSPVEFIRIIRLKKAAELINSSKDLRIGEIAYKVGFTSQSYFAKLFSSQFGVSPKDFAKQIHSQNSKSDSNYKD